MPKPSPSITFPGGITISIAEFDALVGLPKQIHQLLKNQGVIMSKLEELQSAVDAEEVEISHLASAVAEEERRSAEIVAELKKINAGTQDVDLQPIIDRLSAHTTGLRTISAGVTAFDPSADAQSQT